MWKPLEDKVVTISRATGTGTFPANFIVVAAISPWPGSYFGDPVKECTCSPSMITRYRKRVPGPLLQLPESRGTLDDTRCSTGWRA